MLRISDLTDPGRFEKEQYVRLLYQVLLQREPDPVALERLMQRSDVGRFFREFVASAEFRTKAQSSSYLPGLRLGAHARPRVLLFGAYGNGNLGDKIQAASLARAISRLRPDIEVWACSVMRAAFPFPYDRVLPREMFLRPRVVNEFDMLLIGGGGLLAHPHDPLASADWQSAIDIPVAFVGIGASAEVAARSATLLHKAVHVSVRDEHSTASMQRLGLAPAFLPDPVLCDRQFDIRGTARARPKPGGPRRLWILHHRNPELLADWRRLIDPATDEVCFIEPALDFPLLADFPAARPIYRAAELIALIDRADLVVSMRYHGCILAMLRDTPTVGVREHKLLDLFRRYGNERYFAPGPAEISFDLAQYRAPGALLAGDRAHFLAELGGVLAGLKPAQAAAAAAPPADAPAADAPAADAPA